MVRYGTVLLARTPLFVLAALLLAPSAPAAPPVKPREAGRARGSTAKLEPPARRFPIGQSIGSPTEGHLIGGARLTESAYLRIVPAYAGDDARWGLESLVSLIDRAARSVRKAYPDAVLSVGHLSRPGGGEIERHASHESGRDADIGFYVKNQQGKTIFADHFVSFKADGTAPTWPGAQFDDAKNWALVAAIASESSTRVTHIFVSGPLRARLLQYAAKIGAPPSVRVRAAQLMIQPHGGLPHDDHFHVRIGCPAAMNKCVEQPMIARRAPRTTGNAALASARGSATSGRSKPHAPAPRAAGPAKPRPAPPPRPPASEDAEARREPLIPSLAPIVPGLDSVVIPAPLAVARRPAPAEEMQPTSPDTSAIDDPDGVLEPR